jgi:thiamine pyrophosphate-dependent acetolactate synthase large subunit-like protein
MTQPSRMTGGQILIRELLARGVDTVFCVPGES